MIEKENDNKEFKSISEDVSLRNILDGSLIMKRMTIKQYMKIFYIVILILFYITNMFNSERKWREIENLKSEIKDLRSDAITTSSILMKISRQSQVKKLIEERNIGLIESNNAPYKLND